MADEFTQTSRFKIPVPALNNTNWLDFLTHWAEIMDVMFTMFATRDYVISGLTVSTSPSSLGFTYTEGVVSINGVQVAVSSGGGSLTANTFNWLYVQSGIVKLSTYPPSGVPFVAISAIQTDASGSVGTADLRPSPPTVNGITITPAQVNPSLDINIAASKRVLHADSNVSSNIILFSNAERELVKDWGNQSIAKDLEEIDISSFIPSGTKAIIINLRMSTLNANSDGWALLEAKTNALDDDYVHIASDYGHPGAAPLNPSVSGPSVEIVLPINLDRIFRVRTLTSNLGGAGTYYAFVELLGYTI